MTLIDPASTKALKEHLLKALQEHSSGLRSDQARSRVGATGVMVDLSTAAKLLGELRNEGMVTYQNRRWTLKAPLAGGKRKVKHAKPSSPAKPGAGR